MGNQHLSSIASPCIGICSLNPETGFCVGCWRVGSEIAAWSSANAESRMEILAQARKRRDAATSAQLRDDPHD